ncbi:hypothetical protein KFZ56_00605 [Virgibacillus sp. NKC19-3]|uniref:hypothetical protein n=1 Tax=Virgibacillus saliphilus TaxID=2831674 RepID=UPI001C9AEC13|nr:hypothetical protein [Virgibacillus sp. NKC19-3]MBY7141629.1 hypothetical protein [Virgibacillus sp. NKC19-3]
MSILMKKMLTALITTVNVGFIFVLHTYSNEMLETSIVQFLYDLFIFTALFSFMYFAPVIFLIGIPISIGIDKIIFHIRSSKVKSVIRFLLYPIVGLTIILLISIVKGSWPNLSYTNDMGPLVLASVYPSMFFWLIDRLLQK